MPGHLLQLGLHEPLGLALAAGPMLLNVSLLAYAQARLPRDTLSRTFLFFLSMLVVWQLFDVSIRAAETEATAATWRALLRVGQLFAITSGLHFALIVSERRGGRGVLPLTLLYAPCVLTEALYSAGIIQESIEQVPVWGWITDQSTHSAPFTAITIWFSLLAAAIPLVLYRNVYRTRDASESSRNAARLLAWGISLPVGVGILTEAVLPQLLGVRQIPITSTTLSVFSVSVFVALTRYDLFRVDTLAAAQAVLETVSDSLVIVRADGSIRFANPVAYTELGASHGALLWDRVVPPALELRKAFHRALSGERVPSVEATFYRTDGQTMPAQVSMAPLQHDFGALRGQVGDTRSVVVLVHDIGPFKTVETQLAEARDLAEEASRSKSLFVATTSHELRTPLNAIIGYSQFLAEDARDEGAADRLRDLERIETSALMLMRLVDDVLDLSKIESGKLQLRPVQFEVGQLLTEMQPLAEDLCRRHHNHLVLDVGAGPPVLADRDRVRQIVLNLLSNASKFTDRGSIHIRAEAAPPFLRIDIQDDGIGMDESQVSRLFQAFQQVHRHGHDRYRGTGLGLALSQQLCTHMGGRISVRSEPGVGSTFSIHLPIADQPRSDTSSASASAR